MPYYPSNKIITNQVSNGEYSLYKNKDNTNGIGDINDGTDKYFGYYYKLYNGNAYTGRFPGDGSNDLLLYNYTQRSTPSESLVTSPYLSFEPTDEDYKNGIFTRYFSKKRNEFIYRELTKNEYKDLTNPSNTLYTTYETFYVDWKLVGFQQELINYNYFNVKEIEEGQNALGFSEFLKNDYLKYTIIKIGDRW